MAHGKSQEELAELQRNGPAPGSMWVHRKGGVYHVVTVAILEATLTPVVVYEGNGVRWVRPLAEFADGRFTSLTHTRCAPDPRGGHARQG